MNNKKLVILVGAAGTGKSYYATQFYHDYLYINADTMRGVISGDVTDQSNNHLVFSILEKMVEYFMILEKSCVIDNTNMSAKARKTWMDLAVKHGYKVDAVVMNTSFDVAVERNSKRNRQVPVNIIRKQFDSFQEPTKEEGFQDIKFV